MNPVPASVKAPRLPQVNLIPPEVGMRRARGRQRSLAIIALVGLVTILIAAGLLVFITKTSLENDLAQAQEDYAKLEREAADYAEVPVVREVLREITEARSYAGATELDYKLFLDEITGEIPDNVIVEEVVFNKVGLEGPGTPAVGAFMRPDVGQVTFRGVSLELIDVTTLVDSFEQIDGLDRVRIVITERVVEDSVNEADDGEQDVVYDIEIVARLTIMALTGRFAPEDVPPVEPTDEGVTNIEPEPTPTVGPDGEPIDDASNPEGEV
jgi:hypothetical protein